MDFKTRSIVDGVLPEVEVEVEAEVEVGGEGEGKGEGDLSTDHNLFLANPCCSSVPRFEN